MGTCFIIQPFDKGPFDKRYKDVVSPAITDAGLEPYRVDQDPGASIPIEQIEDGIRSAEVCLADITTDNPNVWFELGYAIASRKAVVLLCASGKRAGFPFDIQHRNVVSYDTESASDFEELRTRITKRLKAVLAKESRIDTAAKASQLANVEGLSQHEMVALVSIAQNLNEPSGTVSTYSIRKDMEKAGFTRIAATLGLTGLLRKVLAEVHEGYDDEGNPSYVVYSLTEKGMDWLMTNEDKLLLQEPTDDIPF